MKWVKISSVVNANYTKSVTACNSGSGVLVNIELLVTIGDTNNLAMTTTYVPDSIIESRDVDGDTVYEVVSN